MPKPLPALDSSLLLPPVSPEQYAYFDKAAEHRFDAGAAEPSLRNAWWLAECSLAAYADEELAAHLFGTGGLSIAANGVISGRRYGGRCYVLVDDEKIILAFRGTQTVKTSHLASLTAFRDQMSKVLRDMTTDAKARRVPWAGRSSGTVHRGFAQSLAEMLPEIEGLVDELRAQNPARRLWLTGHSLGAALATLAADCLDEVQGIHVFGSPQVGDREFAEKVRFNGWRFRHHADVISWAPSRLLGYCHVQPCTYFDRAGNAVPEPDNTGLLTDWWKGVPGNATDALASLREGSFSGLAPEALNDHAPLFYAVLVWNAYEAASQRGD